MAETLAQLEAKLSRYQRSGIMSKSKIDGVKKQIADKKKQQQKQAKTGVSDTQKQRQLNVPAKREKDPAQSGAQSRVSQTVKENNEAIARIKKEQQQPFFKGKNVTFSKAQRDKLDGGAGKGSSVIKNILTKIDNAKTLEAENKQRKRFEKLFGVAAPKSTKEYEKVSQISTKMPELKKGEKKVKRSTSVPSVGEMGGGKSNKDKIGKEDPSSAPKTDAPKKAKGESEGVKRRRKSQLNKTKSTLKPLEQGIRKYKTPFGEITADSTDRGMSKFMGSDKEIAEQEMEEEMNFRKGGMARAKAFGKGGTYKSPKKNYTNGINMRYGGATKRSKGY